MIRETIFKGTHFEIGEHQGRIYRKNGMNPNKVIIKRDLFKNQLRAYKKHYPEMLEELKGVANGGKFDEEKTIYNFISSELLWFRGRFEPKACTIFGVKSKNGVFVGRNYDWHPVTENIFEVYKVVPEGRNAFIGITDMGIGGPKTPRSEFFYNPDDALNDKGLFIGLTFAHNNKWNYGISSMDIIKLIAERCITVSDVVKIFKKTSVCCPKNFFVADKNGDMIAVEHTSKRFRVVYPKDDVLIQTNHYVDTELSREDMVLDEKPTHNTFMRYYETLQKVNQRKDDFKLQDVMKILGDVKSCVCQNDSKIKTIWSLALDMKERRYKMYWNVTGKRSGKILDI